MTDPAAEEIMFLVQMLEAMERRDVLAIVGSEHWPDGRGLDQARALIEGSLTQCRPDKVISGGAAGIDTLARVVADEFGIPFEEFLPRYRRWAPGGFKERNLLIVAHCTRMLCVRSSTSTRYGSGWTADRAQEQGRAVTRVVL